MITHSHTHMHAHSLSHTHTHAYTLTHSHTHTFAHTHTLTHRLFFKTVLYSNDREVLSQLVTVVMERAVLLYQIDFFQSQVRVVISDQLMEMFKQHPHFIIDFKQEILDFLSNLRSLNSAGENFYMHLVSTPLFLV